MRERWFVGLASGAACDGVDAALVVVRNSRERMKAEQRHHVLWPFPQDLRRRLAAWSGLARPTGSLGEDPVRAAGDLAQLDRDTGLVFAEAANGLIEQSGVRRGQIAAVGSSGQTVVRHRPPGEGGAAGIVEVGSPAVLAAGTMLPVVSGFGASDLAVGGCGSPVTAWADWRLLRHRRLSRVAVHLGGLVSLTFVGSDFCAGDVVAFDVGPGTILCDRACRGHLGQEFDADGAAAARGSVCAPLLQECLANEYFLRKPPKAASPADWGWIYWERLTLAARRHGCANADLLATATELTAQAVARAVGRLTERPHEVILSGGGGLNIHLAGRIRSLLSPSSTYTFERYGPSLRGKQGVCMAMLAAARLDGFAAHCPAATGAARPAVLGSVTMP